LTPANVADNNHQVLHTLLDGLKGECYGDKPMTTQIWLHTYQVGYTSRLFEQFYQQGLQIVTKLKARMANKLMRLSHKLRLKK
jgi:hypothetical protein